MYKWMGRLLDFNKLEGKVNSGCRIIIISGNVIFNGIVLEPEEEKLDHGHRSGKLIRKIRVTKSYLKRRYPSADIVDAVHYV